MDFSLISKGLFLRHTSKTQRSCGFKGFKVVDIVVGYQLLRGWYISRNWGGLFSHNGGTFLLVLPKNPVFMRVCRCLKQLDTNYLGGGIFLVIRSKRTVSMRFGALQ